MTVKYVMTNIGPIILPTTMSHSDFIRFNPTSAAMCRFYVSDKEEVGVRCFGESTSLKMGVDPEDEERIRRYLLQEY
jgi:hypothetical protein